MKYLNNSPLKSILQDEIGRLHAVEYVLDLVSSDEALSEIFYLTAPKGSGRTSTLNFLDNCIENQSEVIKEFGRSKNKTEMRINKHLKNIQNCSSPLFKVRIDCGSFIPSSGDNLNFFIKQIFDSVLLSESLRKSFLISTGTYRGGKGEYAIERALFPNLQKEKADIFVKDGVSDTQLREVSSGIQCLMLVDNYDRLDKVVKSEFRNGLTRLHEKFDNIISVIAVNLEGMESFQHVHTKDFVMLPTIVGEEKNFEAFLNRLKETTGIELRKQWGPLLHHTFKEDVAGLKTFLNNLLVYPGSDFDRLKLGRFWPLNNLEDLSSRKEFHYSRLAAILMIRHKFPGKLEAVYGGPEGAIAFIDDILSNESHSVYNPDDVSSFVRGLFSKDNNGLAYPFFIAADAQPYINLRFAPRKLSEVEEKLLLWCQSPDKLNTLLDNAENSTKTSAKIIIDSLEAIDPAGEITQIDKFRLKYWMADASFRTFIKLSDEKIIDAKFNDEDHGLLRDWSNALDTADELIEDARRELPRIMKQASYDSKNGVRGGEGYEIAWEGLEVSFDFLQLEIRISRNEFKQARMLVEKIRQYPNFEMHEQAIKNSERELLAKEKSSVGSDYQYDLFISHRNAELDNYMAVEIKNALRQINSELKVYLYLDESRAGDLWTEELWLALNSSKSFLLLTSESYMSFRDDYRENWTHAESMMARYCNHRKKTPIFWSYLTGSSSLNDDVWDEGKLVEEFKWLQAHQSLGIQVMEPPRKKLLQTEKSYQNDKGLWERRFRDDCWSKAQRLVNVILDRDVKSEFGMDNYSLTKKQMRQVTMHTH